MQTGPCAVLPFWEWTVRHTASSTPLTPSHDNTQHTNKPNTDTAHGATNNEMTTANEKGIRQRAKVGQHSSTNTLIEAATTQLIVKHTGLWLTIEGWVDATDNDKVFDTKPSHSHPHHPTTKPLHPFIPLHSQTQISCLLPFPQHSTPLLLHIVCMPHCHNHTSFDC